MTAGDEPLRPGAVLFPFQQAVCGLPDCGKALYMQWGASRPIYLSDTAADLSGSNDAHTSSWEVTCEGGHTVLLPIDDGKDNAVFGACRCEPGDGSDWCGHTDMTRLRAVLGAGTFTLVT